MKPTNPHLFPTSSYVASLDAWAANLQSSSTSQAASRCFIERIVHYKALSDMEHEFLIVHTRHTVSGCPVVLGVDRNAEEHMDQATSSRYISNKIMSVTGRVEDPASRGMTAFDGVEVSHDATDTPILTRHGPSLELNTLSFITRAPADMPTLHHLTVLLLAIRQHFPSYILLQHQCYFFARAVLLSLKSIFPHNTESRHPQNYALQGTWRGAHLSIFAAGKAALQNMLLLPLIEFPVLLIPAGLFALYTTVTLYDGHSVSGPRDRLDISDDKIREFDIPSKYKELWSRYMAMRNSG